MLFNSFRPMARRASVLAVSSVVSSWAFAAPQASTAEVVVTANRFERPSDQVLADVTVITAAQLERAGAGNLLEVLQRQPGVFFANNGGRQQGSTLFIRGADSKHTLFLIDGQRIGPLDGFTQFQFQHFPVEQIERIEILRGPASSLYGSDAIGGVVQIITKKAGDQNGGEISLGIGSNQTRKLSGSATLAGERGSVRLGAGHEYSNGINARRDASGDDAYRVSSANLSANYALTSTAQVTFSALGTETYNEFDPNPQFNRDRQTVLNLGLSQNWQNGSRSTARLGSSKEELKFPLFAFGTESEQRQFALEHKFDAKGATFLLGYEYLDQSFRQQTNFPPPAGAPNIQDTEANSVLGSVSYAVGQLQMQFNLRHDNNSNYRNVTTGQASLALALAPGYSVGTSFGTGFKRPTFSQISGFVNTFAPGFAGVDPLVFNTGLRPEESDSVEVFFTADTALGESRVTVFRNEVQDRIDGVEISPGNTRFFNADGQSRIEGLTLVHDYAWNTQWSAGGSVDLLSAKGADGQRLLRRPSQSAKLYATWTPQEKLSLYGELLAVGQRDDQVFGVGRVRLGGYGLLNMNARYELSKMQTLNLRVDNLTGKDYEVIRGFSVPRQDVMLTFQQRF